MKYLKTKLLIYISSILVLTVTFLTIISSVLFYRSAETQAKQYSSYLAAAYQEDIDSALNIYRRYIEIIASKSYMNDVTVPMDERNKQLSEDAKAMKFNYVSIADSNGNNSRNDVISDKDFFKEAANGNTYISDPAVNTSGQLTLMVATPISSSGKILYGEIPYDLISAELDQIKIGESGYAFVVNKSGLTVIHPEQDNVINPIDYFEASKSDSSYMPIANIFKEMISGKTGTGYSNYKGVRRLVAYAPLEGPEGWSVAVTTPVTQLDESLQKTIEICVGIGIALLLIAIVITRVFSLMITKPIVKATQRIELLAKGDLHEENENILGKDESARLMLALQNTVNGLRSYIIDISHVLDAVANKNLTVESNVKYTGDFVSIQESLIKIVQSLNDTLFGIAQSTEQVRVGSEQVAMGGQNLAESSTEQAATIEQLTESLNLISRHIQENAEYSITMKDTAHEALAETEHGDIEMKKMLQSMEDINSYSKKIQGIINVIDDISFQTSILALNAAIEASHAGEAGKGFSVVVDEVRQLAAKSAEAAKNTAELIDATMNSVGQGMKNAERTAESFRQIVNQTNIINNLVSKMSDSLSSQSKSINDLNEGMNRISAVTQTNSATAEEDAAISEELLSQMETLRGMIAEFKTTDNNYN